MFKETVCFVTEMGDERNLRQSSPKMKCLCVQAGTRPLATGIMIAKPIIMLLESITGAACYFVNKNRKIKTM